MPWLRGFRAALLVLACTGGALPPAAVAAQAAQTGQRATASAAAGRSGESAAQRILMLRPSGAAPTPIAVAVEGALGRALEEIGFAVTSSPLPFHDAQLVAGCNGTWRECGSDVAKALESEHLAVARLEQTAAGRAVRLELFVFESGGAVREGSAELSLAPDASLEPSLRALVQRVFGQSSPSVVAAVAAPQSEASALPTPAHAPQPQLLRSFGWASLGTGGALLIGALATSLSAQSASRAYARSEVDSRDDADRALAHYDSAQRRAEIANVLWGVGAGAVTAGAFMLLWERLATPADRNLQQTARRGRRTMRVSAAPAPAGVALALRGEL